MRSSVFLWIFVVITLSWQSFGGDSEGPKQRRVVLGLSGDKYTQAGFEGSAYGMGIFAKYEFVLNPRFALGILTSVRRHPGEERIDQFSYGLTMQHRWENLVPEATPYFEYGLLMQVVRVTGHRDPAMAHNTRLAGGVLFGCTFVELSYHISRLQHFDAERVNLDHVALNAGIWFDRQ